MAKHSDKPGREGRASAADARRTARDRSGWKPGTTGGQPPSPAPAPRKNTLRGWARPKND